MTDWNRYRRKVDAENRIARVPVGAAEPEGAAREALVLEMIALVQAPYAMTTPESRQRIREVADKLEGKL